jgi:hypothetical protein
MQPRLLKVFIRHIIINLQLFQISYNKYFLLSSAGKVAAPAVESDSDSDVELVAEVPWIPLHDKFLTISFVLLVIDHIASPFVDPSGSTLSKILTPVSYALVAHGLTCGGADLKRFLYSVAAFLSFTTAGKIIPMALQSVGVTVRRDPGLFIDELLTTGVVGMTLLQVIGLFLIYKLVHNPQIRRAFVPVFFFFIGVNALIFGAQAFAAYQSNSHSIGDLPTIPGRKPNAPRI